MNVKKQIFLKKEDSFKLFSNKNHLNGDGDSRVGKKWYDSEIPVDPKDFPEASHDVIEKLKNEAKLEMEKETMKHKEKISTRSDYKWITTIMSKGTNADKIASYTVSIQDYPMQSLPILHNLVGMIKMGKRKDCFTVIDTLTELFLEDLIPNNMEKLRPFSHRPLVLLDAMSNGKPSLRRKILISWLMEDEMKKVFSDFVAAVCEVAAKDSIEKNRIQAVSALHNLLIGTAEKEDVILANLVNKLGDRNVKVASKAMHCLKQLLLKHPNMQGVVKDEIEKLLFRPNIGSKAQFYGLCFLNQYYLSPEDQELAQSLIKLYFSFFKACVKKGELESKMMCSLLTGVRRAYPFAKLKVDDVALVEHIQTVHKVVHLGSFNISVHALSLLLQVMDCSTDAISDRFYTALYKKVMDPQLAASNLQAMFISMCYKAVKSDLVVERKKAFVKRFLQVCLYAPVPLACGILYMISEILRKCRDPQMLWFHNVEGEKGKEPIHVADTDDDNDEYEHYADIKLEEDADKVEVKVGRSEQPLEGEEDWGRRKKQVSESSWVHRRCRSELIEGRRPAGGGQNGYDAHQRNPRFALPPTGGTYSELVQLSNHFHPTVALFAQMISRGESIEYTGDPLQDFALLRFLNRFAFKNPKKAGSRNQGEESADAVQRIDVSVFSRKRDYAPQGVRSLPLTCGSYLTEKEENIPVEERFLYNYMRTRRSMKADDKGEAERESDNDSVNSDEFEEVMNEFISGGKKKESTSVEEDIEEDVDFADGIDFDEQDGDGDDGDIEPRSTKRSKKKVLTKKRKAVEVEESSGSESEAGDDDITKVFASAEEFSEMLQDTGSSGLHMGGSSGVSNQDNSALKQLQWEESRDKWIKGVDRFAKRSRGRGGSSFGKKRKFAKAKLKRK
ncbi:CCAAT/enhancer-binding protein zeta [Ischnura elegans]|uniref:CCAAT/enhancer-binding protein zeta n=1 Tax=Ischnura elegans TaxID=197161 RepID=UPI001ED8891C|nr:CCAAT/enhancer-binding protein zeta [Ischnura elegans]